MAHNIQRNSIRKRYLVFSILIITGLLICVAAAHVYVSIKVQQSNRSHQDQDQVLRIITKIQGNLAKSQNIVTEHLILASPKSILRWKSTLREMITNIELLQHSRWIQQQLQDNNIKRLRKNVLSLHNHTLKLFKVRLNTDQQFPALFYARDMMLPHNQNFISSINNAIDSLNTNNPHSNVERQLTHLRSLWSQMINHFRMYTINRLTSLSVNTLPTHVRNIRNYNIEIRKKINLLKALDKKKVLELETSEALGKLSTNAANWYRYFNVVAAINQGPHWRTDIIIRNRDVQPAYARVNQNLKQLTHQLDMSLARNFLTLTSSMNDLAITLWSLALVGILFILYSYYYFDTRILKPVDQISEALENEINGKIPNSLPEGKLREANNLINALSNMKEHVQQKQAILEHQALHDSLTQLPNRFMLEKSLHEYISLPSESSPITLMVMDLDNFKHINDSLGHQAGDIILSQVGQRIKTIIRDTDIVARLGGDEFAILLPDSDQNTAKLVAQKIYQQISIAFEVNNHSLKIGCSIGIATYPLHASTPEELLNIADKAMYYAKRAHIPFALHKQIHTTRPGPMSFR